MESNNNWDVYLGLVTEDKEDFSRIIRVFVKELSPFFVGALEDTTEPKPYQFYDDITDEYLDDETNTTNRVMAEWFSMDTNRAFPPNVRRGEQVMVFKYRDNDLYYWVSMGRDDNLRRLEWHRIHVSDDVECEKELTENNTYYFEMDTLFTKRIRLVANKSDGENFWYEITIDSGNDSIILQDDIGNIVTIQSGLSRVLCMNSTGSYCDIVGPDVLIHAPNNIKMTAGNNIIAEAGNNIEITAANELFTNSTDTYNTSKTLTLNKSTDYKTEVTALIEEKAKNIHEIAEEKNVRDAPEIGDNSDLHVCDTAQFGVTGSAYITGMVSTPDTFMGPIIMTPGPGSPGPIEL